MFKPVYINVGVLSINKSAVSDVVTVHAHSRNSKFSGLIRVARKTLSKIESQ